MNTQTEVIAKSPAENIIEKFGGISALAGALGHKNPSTVQGWKERGLIPAKRQKQVIDAARDRGIGVTANDFIEGSVA
jgi:hypothetical protein